MKPILYYVHDPMCSWCWGYRPTWDALQQALPEDIQQVNVVGGLAPDSDEAMPMEQQKLIAGHWQRIAEELGTKFNFDFWTNCAPRRSTYPACRAVLAAAAQGAEEAMINAIQHAYYLRAMNPSDASTLIALAKDIGLDTQRFTDDLASAGIQRELERHFALRRSIDVYSFPSLVLQIGQESYPVPLDYQDHQISAEFIAAKVADCVVAAQVKR
ncbi:MAG: DsbA family protein [Proteobacteria bacterium]|nr:DsbA family protein [Pseudomonadota bacterium]